MVKSKTLDHTNTSPEVD